MSRLVYARTLHSCELFLPTSYKFVPATSGACHGFAKLTATKVERTRLRRMMRFLLMGMDYLSLRTRRSRDATLSRWWLYAYKDGSKSVYLTLGGRDSALANFDLAPTDYQLGPGSPWTSRGASLPKNQIGESADSSPCSTHWPITNG
jgi:hypothetical protein